MSRSNPWKSKPRTTKHTTLIIVEGDAEQTFLKHFRAIFGRSCGTQVKIQSVFGGSGDAVLRHAIKICNGYDHRAVLYDADRPPQTKQFIQQARQLNIEHLVSIPAIEGVLLAILDITVPQSTQECKRILAQHIRSPLTESSTFQRHFPETVLRERSANVQILTQLFAIFRVTPIS